MSINRRLIKAWRIHKKGHHAAIKRNEEAQYVLLWTNELQNKWISKQNPALASFLSGESIVSKSWPEGVEGCLVVGA